MTSYKDELRHYGIKGQKHGKRRFQNEDGSLTAAGRARYGVSKGDNRHGILSVSDQRAGGGPKTKGKLDNAPKKTNSDVEAYNRGMMQELAKSSNARVKVYKDANGRITRINGRNGTNHGQREALRFTYGNDNKITSATGYATKKGKGKTKTAIVGKEEVQRLNEQFGSNQKANAGVRTTGNRNPREMGMGAARTTRNADGSISRRTDNGDVVLERKRKDGTSEVIRQSGRGDTRTVVGRNGATRESYKVVGEDDIRNKRTERGLRGEKHEVVNGKVHDSTDHIQSHYDTSNRDKAEALKKRGHISSELAEQYRKAREKGAAAAYVEQWQKERDKQVALKDEFKSNIKKQFAESKAKAQRAKQDRQMGVGAARKVLGARYDDHGNLIWENRTGSTRLNRDGTRAETMAYPGSAEKHEVVKASKRSQSAKNTGVAAVGKTASKQLSSVLSKARSMAAKEAVKKGAVVKKKKKG